MNNKTLTFSAGIIGALILGSITSWHAANLGANFWICTAFFTVSATIAVLIFHLLQVCIEDISGYFINKRIKSTDTSKVEFIKNNIELSSPCSIPIITNEIKKETIQEEIPINTIFKIKMYDKFLILEKRLIADGYLNQNLHWLAKRNNKKPDIKRLVIFLTGCIEKGYFLSRRDTKIKKFFEIRYNVSLGQSFEKKRREQYITEYSMIFFNYPF